jgi:uncharacterized phiE125 gp8 family phage protein
MMPMEFKISTAITTEPVSLAEVKLHRRLSSNTVSGDFATTQSIVPGAHVIAASFGLVGSAVDVLGKIVLVNLNAGTCGAGGSVAAKIQESDDNAIWSDWTGGAFTTVTESNDNAVQEIDYTGVKQYIRVVATVAGATCGFGADIVTLTGDATEDSLLTDLITAAREYCEGITGRSFATQTITAYLDAFPCADRFELPRPPLQSVTSIKYKNSGGTETTMTATTDYLVDTDSNIGKIVLPYSKSWPSFTPYPVNPITIVYVAGYAALPKSLKQAMLIHLGYFYEHRDEAALNEETKKLVLRLLAQYKTWWF